MKKMVVFAVILFTYLLSAQEGWFLQNPLPSENFIHSSYFIDENLGWCIGPALIMKTTDGGESWINQNSPIPSELEAVQFANADTGWIAVRINKVLRTFNGGDDWETIELNTGHHLFSLCFIGTQTGWICGSNGSVFKTIDGGLTWQLKNSNTSNHLRSIYFANSSFGYASGDNGTIIKTTDGGESWQVLNGQTTDILFDIDFIDENNGWIAGGYYGQGTILKTSDAGQSWSQFFIPDTAGFASIDFINSSIGIAGNYNGKIYKSTNGGITWNIVLSDANSKSIRNVNAININKYYSFGVVGIAEDPLVLVTTNGGSNWIYKCRWFNLTHIYSTFFVNENDGWLAGNYIWTGKIYRTTDGGETWLNQISAPDTYLRSIFFINQYIGWAAGENQIFKTVNSGNSWQTINIGITVGLRSIYFVDEYYGWAVGYNNVIIKSTDAGLTWIRQNSPYIYPWSIYFLNRDVGWVLGEYGNILQTTNGGDNWISVSNVPNCNYNEMKFANDTTGFIVGDVGVILKTTNRGADWFQIQSNLSNDLKCIFIVNESNIYIAGENTYIYHSSNFGVSWTEQQSLKREYSDIFFINESTGWATGYWNFMLKTTSGGFIPVALHNFNAKYIQNDVYLNWSTATETNNQGFQIDRRKTQNERSEEWQSIGFISGRGTTTERQVYSFVDENLQAGKYQYRLKQIDFDGSIEYSNTIEVEINQPTMFSLRQNYPNPFNPVTKISYTIPTSPSLPLLAKEWVGVRFVTLKVFDVLGEEVTTLVNEEKPAGSYEVDFDARNLASGIYYYQLRAGDFVETKKMILMK
jgi:photosystem II stability/assembly factor-like uncharacterized protein